MKNLFLFASILALAACKNEVKTDAPVADVVGLCSPIQLQPDSTVLYLSDYFLQPERLDSFALPAELGWKYAAGDSTKLILRGNTERAYSLFSAYSGALRFDIPLKRSTRVAYTYMFDAAGTNYATVQIRGSFNAWNKTANPMVNTGRSWFTDLKLQPGSYEYLLVIDGVEMLDPNNPEKAPNGQGGFNSVLKLVDDSPEPNHVTTTTHTDTGFALYLNGYGLGEQDLLVFWQNQTIAPREVKGDTIFYSVPSEALGKERSFIRAYTGNATKFGNDVLIPLHHRNVVTNPLELTRNDWEAASMYFLMIDRFKNGNTKNDSTIKDPDINPKANYFGGDIAGITQEIQSGYFDSLGLNTIWISPITQNPWDAWGLWDKGGPTTKFSGYHGYWPISNVLPERRFASQKELHLFLDDAHAHNKNVLLDYVASHVHQNHPIYKEHKDWATPLFLPDGRMNTELWDEHRLTTWFDTFLPKLDLSRPEIADPMSDSALVWITTYDFDGYRHDATKHIDEVYWRILTKKTKERVMVPNQKRIYQIGETYGSPELISSYISSGMLDAQFDFNVYDALVGTLVDKKGSFTYVAGVLQSSLKWYGHHHLMGNISGNQDRSRFVSYASGAIKLGEDGKLAGWSRTIGKPKPAAYNRLALLHAFNFAVPGIPVIYYGDEIGLPGANDPDNRRMMKLEAWDADEAALFKTVQSLTKLRNSSMALLYGSTEVTVVSDDVLIIHRQYFEEHVWFIINKGEKQVSIDVDVFKLNNISELEEGPAGELFMQLPVKGKLSFVVNPNSFGTLITKKIKT
jgi:glycosidase